MLSLHIHRAYSSPFRWVIPWHRHPAALSVQSRAALSGGFQGPCPTGQHSAVLCLPLVSRPSSIQCYACNESPLFPLSAAFFPSLFVWNKHIQMSCSVRLGEIQPCLFNLLLPSFKAGKYQVEFCTNLKNKSAAQKFFLIISPIIYWRKKKDNSYSAFITVTRIKHVILMLSSNLQMARCNQHI